MSHRADGTKAETDRYYVDGDKLDPAEIIGPPLLAIETATRILTLLDQPDAEVGSKDCLRLFVAVGELRFMNWDFVEILWTPLRRGKVRKPAEDLYQRLAESVHRFRTRMLELLEESLQNEAARIDEGMRMSAEYLRTTGEPGLDRLSIEFSEWVTYPLDQIGFASAVCVALGLRFSPTLTARLEELDGRLRESLPVIAKAFREAGEPIDAVEPRMFPASFWWCRLAEDQAGAGG